MAPQRAQLVGRAALQAGVDAESHRRRLEAVQRRSAAIGARYGGNVLDVETWPRLRDPVMVVSLTGWIDAGEAGELAGATLASQLEGAREFGSYSLDDLVDLQQTRPTVELLEGTTRHITWPKITLTAGHAGRDVVIAAGPEPSLRWPTFARDLVELADRLDVKQAFTLGGMPAAVSHRLPVNVLATASAHSVAQEVGAMRTDYEGPTGAQTVVQFELGKAGIPSVGLWAQVPHYVSGNPSPPAVLRAARAPARAGDAPARPQRPRRAGRPVPREGRRRCRRAPRRRRSRAGDRGPDRRRGLRRRDRRRDRAVPARPVGPAVHAVQSARASSTGVPGGGRPGQGRPAAAPGDPAATCAGRHDRARRATRGRLLREDTPHVAPLNRRPRAAPPPGSRVERGRAWATSAAAASGSSRPGVTT